MTDAPEPDVAAGLVEDDESTVRTAIVIVHGMGEQLPSETLYRFVKTALPKIDYKRHYFSRPADVTDSFEARRCLAYRPYGADQSVYGQTEFFEYHWSYLMTDNKLSDLAATTRRLLLRKPSLVPYGLKWVWWILWAILIATLLAVLTLIRYRGGVTIKDFTLGGIATALGGSAILVGILKLILGRFGGILSKSLVDVVRYLDRSPRSYAVRHDIRKGMVDLLQSIHDRNRYSRIVIVAHSLGAFIAYDGIAYLWPRMCHLHAGGAVTDDPAHDLVLELERRARAVVNHPDTPVHPTSDGTFEDIEGESRALLDRYQEQQFKVWKQLRRQGNPWLVTDFVSVGTPMYFADLLYTAKRSEFDQLIRNAEIPVCPPQAGSQTVEGANVTIKRYGFVHKGRTVLAHGAPFAVVRWTNLFFPAERSWRGDWFGGPLRGLFGKGILDQPLHGNLPGRRAPGFAHSRYFSYPDDDAPHDVAPVLQGILRLDLDPVLEELRDLPAHEDVTPERL
ncbi:MAG: hypothetical protein ABIQ09_03915 [Jatrophihabitantaceae bacterium]